MNAYGTYSLKTGKHWQVKEKVNRNTIYLHLKGIKPYGFYPLTGNLTRVGAIDFDSDDPELPIQFIERAKHYELKAHLEKSKSKGYHVWMFFLREGVNAGKVRTVIKYILNEVESLETEIFPKQDVIYEKNLFGNFINAPLFGKLVPEGKTVFVKPDATLEPYPNQWEVLESIKRINEDILDSIIDINSLDDEQNDEQNQNSCLTDNKTGFSLPICMRRILNQGVTFDQRVSCFRIAVHLKRVGIPYDIAVAALLQWRFKNKPKENKRIITEEEIKEQVKWAYNKNYTGYGCQELVISSFCDPECPVKIRSRS